MKNWPDTLSTQIWQWLFQRQLIKIKGAKYRGIDKNLLRVQAHPVLLKQQLALKVVYQYKTQDVTKNFILHQLQDMADILTQFEQLGFKSFFIQSISQNITVDLNKRGEAKINYDNHQTKVSLCTTNIVDVNNTKKQPRNTVQSITKDFTLNNDDTTLQQGHNQIILPITQHDRIKTRYVQQSAPYLHYLGVTDFTGQIIPTMARKWKQINKFVEIFETTKAQINVPNNKPIHVVDFGCGKGYLTFALYDYLQNQGGQPHVVGIELRPKLVDLCNDVATKSHFNNMQFFADDVQHFNPAKLDVMIALHACDIATDYALFTGIRFGAQVIMTAPCCHKEIRPQMARPAVLAPLLRFGVHLSQEAEMLTDSIRAVLLDACGYDVKLLEFVSLEHTSKNKMILATKKQGLTKQQLLAHQHQKVQELQNLMHFYGIQTQKLKVLLEDENLICLE